MYLDNKDSVSLNELIIWVKKELFTETTNDPVPLFVIDEVIIEVNFVLSGKGKSGFDLKVVNLEGELSEDRVQKAIVHLRPIVPLSTLRQELTEGHAEIKQKIIDDSIKVLFKGKYIPNELPPQRE